MRDLPAFVTTSLIVGWALFPTETHADGQACLAILKQANDLNTQFYAARKNAEHEDECNAEGKLWLQSEQIIEKRIAMESQITSICAGFTITRGVTLEELNHRAQQARKFAAAAKDGCEPLEPPQPVVRQKDPSGGLVGSGTISCFGGGNCDSQRKTQPNDLNGAPRKVAPRGTQPTITGKEFGDKAPPSTGPSTVMPAK